MEEEKKEEKTETTEIPKRGEEIQKEEESKKEVESKKEGESKKEEHKDGDWAKFLFPNEAPIEVFKDRVWIVEGLLNKIKRNMMIYKMNNGKLLVHSVVCCDVETMKKIDSYGEIGVIYIPNLQHTYDCVRYSARYPKADVVAPGNMIAEIKKAKNLTPLNALEYFQKKILIWELKHIFQMD